MPSPYQYFTLDELACKGINCCHGQASMDENFMDKITIIRHELAFPFVISSAYRCPIHNQEVSTTGPQGPHTTGKAIDILVHHVQAYLLLEAAMLSGMFTGVGINQKGDWENRFIHLDDIPGENRIWTY